MTEATKRILKSFDRLPDSEKREVAAEILRRTLSLETGPLSDEELILAAEALFLELDRSESQNGQS